MIRLDIYVSDIDSVTQVFDYLKVYRSDNEDGPFTEKTTPTTMIRLVSGVSDYRYLDPYGTTDHWYKSSYYSSRYHTESALSGAVRGGDIQLYHRAIYPPEASFTADQEDIIQRVRKYLGDFKKLKYMYYADCTDIVTPNPHIVDLKTKMWPLYISLNDEEKNSTSDPYVDGYRYLTFSGIVEPNSTLEIFYSEFRYSNYEIYEAYTTTAIPPGLTQATVTTEHMVLQCAIDLLEAENADDFIQEGAKIKEGDDSFDPDAGFRARGQLLRRLKKKLDDLITQYMFIGIDGILVD